MIQVVQGITSPQASRAASMPSLPLTAETKSQSRLRRQTTLVFSREHSLNNELLPIFKGRLSTPFFIKRKGRIA